MLMSEVEIDFNVLRPFMKDWIGDNLHGTLIVIRKRYRIYKKNIKVC